MITDYRVSDYMYFRFRIKKGVKSSNVMVVRRGGGTAAGRIAHLHAPSKQRALG